MFDNVQVTGLDELERALVSIGAEMGYPILRKASRAAMKPVKTQMQENAPFDDDPNRDQGPHLRNKISVNVRKKGSRGSQQTAATTRVGPTKAHSQKAIAAEYGTTNQGAQPFIRSALFDNRYRVVETFKQVLRAKLLEVTL